MQHFRIQCASVFIVRNHDGAFVRRRFPHADEPADYLQPHIRNTVGTVAHKGHWKKNIISFVRFYEFLRINISYVRLYEILFFLYEIYISYKINTNSYEQNSISIRLYETLFRLYEWIFRSYEILIRTNKIIFCTNQIFFLWMFLMGHRSKVITSYRCIDFQ